MEEAQKHGAVALTAPVRATLVEVDEGGNPMAYHFPRSFVQLQTPQAFSKAKFLEMAASGRELHPLRPDIGRRFLVECPAWRSGRWALLLGGDAEFLPKAKMKSSSGPFEEACSGEADVACHV